MSYDTHKKLITILIKFFDGLENLGQKSFVEIEDIAIKEWQKMYLLFKVDNKELPAFPNKTFINETIFNVLIDKKFQLDCYITMAAGQLGIYEPVIYSVIIVFIFDVQFSMVASKTDRYNFQNLQLTPLITKTKIIQMQKVINNFYKNKIIPLENIEEDSFATISNLLNDSTNQIKFQNFLVKTLENEDINAKLQINVDQDWFLTNLTPAKLSINTILQKKYDSDHLPNNSLQKLSKDMDQRNPESYYQEINIINKDHDYKENKARYGVQERKNQMFIIQNKQPDQSILQNDNLITQESQNEGINEFSHKSRVVMQNSSFIEPRLNADNTVPNQTRGTSNSLQNTQSDIPYRLDLVPKMNVIVNRNGSSNANKFANSINKANKKSNPGSPSNKNNNPAKVKTAIQISNQNNYTTEQTENRERINFINGDIDNSKDNEAQPTDPSKNINQVSFHQNPNQNIEHKKQLPVDSISLIIQQSNLQASNFMEKYKQITKDKSNMKQSSIDTNDNKVNVPSTINLSQYQSQPKTKMPYSSKQIAPNAERNRSFNYCSIVYNILDQKNFNENQYDKNNEYLSTEALLQKQKKYEQILSKNDLDQSYASARPVNKNNFNSKFKYQTITPQISTASNKAINYNFNHVFKEMHHKRQVQFSKNPLHKNLKQNNHQIFKSNKETIVTVNNENHKEEKYIPAKEAQTKQKTSRMSKESYTDSNLMMAILKPNIIPPLHPFSERPIEEVDNTLTQEEHNSYNKYWYLNSAEQNKKAMSESYNNYLIWEEINKNLNGNLMNDQLNQCLSALERFNNLLGITDTSQYVIDDQQNV